MPGEPRPAHKKSPLADGQRACSGGGWLAGHVAELDFEIFVSQKTFDRNSQVRFHKCMAPTGLKKTPVYRPQNIPLARFYWRTAKRWPVVHAIGCCWGLFVGVGCLYLFWDPQPNKRLDIFLRPLGVLMLAVYGWWLIAFVLRLTRGTWSGHCDSQILFFTGIDDSGVQKRSMVLRFKAKQILAASLVTFAVTVLMFVEVRLHWHDPITPVIFSVGLFYLPLLCYIAIRSMTETGFSRVWFFSVVFCFIGMGLWAWIVYALVRKFEL